MQAVYRAGPDATGNRPEGKVSAHVLHARRRSHVEPMCNCGVLCGVYWWLATSAVEALLLTTVAFNQP